MDDINCVIGKITITQGIGTLADYCRMIVYLFTNPPDMSMFLTMLLFLAVTAIVLSLAAGINEKVLKLESMFCVSKLFNQIFPVTFA